MSEVGNKMLPVGIEDFEEIRTEGYYYVDKTGMIKDLLTKRSKVSLFTRPRRFGKSLNMSMLRCFFEIGHSRDLFEGLEIAGRTDICDKYMGQFPVVSITLKGVNGADYKTARGLAVNMINEEARRLQFLFDSDRLTLEDKAMFSLLFRQEMADGTLMCSLRNLSELLYKHYGKKTILLIDEYDVPLAKAHEKKYYEEMVSLIRNMFEQALKTNESLYFAVLSGCLRVSKESIFTGLNNPKILSITSVRYDEYFGFTDDEVRELLGYYGLEDKYSEVKAWYDGYRFGNVDVYCPWDVISYCDDLLDDAEAEPQHYWSNTSSNEVVRHLLEMSKPETRDDIERLIAGEIITKKINEELTYKELYQNIDNVWSVLFATGYLTQRGKKTGREWELSIPNREILDIFMEKISDWVLVRAAENPSRLTAFCEAFRRADGETVQRIFSEYLCETISIRDTAVRKELKENFYHGFLLGLLRYKEDWKVISNRESGKGYADIVVELQAEKLGIVIEIKYPDNGNLDAGCAEAIKQILDIGYLSQLRLDGMSKIIKCGIACCVKECKVIFE